METLLNIDPVTSDQNLKGLRKLYTDVEANTRSLKALGVEPETYGAMLASVAWQATTRLVLDCGSQDS